jgi:hypothetical protein
MPEASKAVAACFIEGAMTFAKTPHRALKGGLDVITYKGPEGSIGYLAHKKVWIADDGNKMSSMRVLSASEAKKWLIRNGHEDVGTSLPDSGRPPTGKKVEFRMDTHKIHEVDTLAKEKGISRAEMLRRLVNRALDETGKSQ